MKVKDLIKRYAPCEDGLACLHDALGTELTQEEFLNTTLNWDTILAYVYANPMGLAYHYMGWLANCLPYKPLEDELKKEGYKLYKAQDAEGKIRRTTRTCSWYMTSDIYWFDVGKRIWELYTETKHENK